MYIFFTQPDSHGRSTPFLLDAMMYPVTAVNSWLREIAQDGATSSPITWKTYAYHLFDFFSFLEENNLDWRSIRAKTLFNYRDVQALYKSSHTKQFLNRGTINARLMSVSRFYTFALENGFASENPFKFKRIKAYRPADTDMLAHITSSREREAPSVLFRRVGRNSIKWQPHDTVVKWLNSIQAWRDKLIAKVMYRTGMRRAEIANLKIHDLPEPGSTDISRPEIPFIILGKGRKQRMVYLLARDFIELHDYIKIERAKLIRASGLQHDFLFIHKTGRPVSPEDLNRIFKGISDRCNIRITPHILRHSFAVQALSDWKAVGMSQPVKLLQARLGHSSLVTTQIYMHITDEVRIEEAHMNASLIDRFIEEG